MLIRSQVQGLRHQTVIDKMCTGTEETLPVEQVTGLVLSIDVERSGYCECSDESINPLYQSIYWKQLDNFVDVPVNCPQRDKPFGWAGDAQVFASIAAYKWTHTSL